MDKNKYENKAHAMRLIGMNSTSKTYVYQQ